MANIDISNFYFHKNTCHKYIFPCICQEIKPGDEILTEHFGDRKLFQISAVGIEEFKKLRKEPLARGKKTDPMSPSIGKWRSFAT